MPHQMKHIKARDEAHARNIVCAYVLQCGAATVEEGDNCMVLCSGFSVQTDSLVAVITWEA
jgi:hypothetical protein